MAEEIILEYLLDQPNILTTREETEIKVLLKLDPSNLLRGIDKDMSTAVAVVLVIDCSSSMKNPEFRATIEAAKKIVEMLRPSDYLSVIAFQSVTYEILANVRVQSLEEKNKYKRQVDTIESLRGGGTDLEYALIKAEHHLNMITDSHVAKKVIVLTDGQVTGLPENCLRQAEKLGLNHISIDCLGFGPEFDYAFSQKLVSFSNGFTDRISKASQIGEVFEKRVLNLQSVIALNTKLDLTFTQEVRAGRIYRYSPEIVYMDRIYFKGEDRVYPLNIGNIEKNKEYAYLLTMTVPRREEGNVRILKAILQYDIPTLQISQGSSLQSVVVAYTSDPEKANIINPQVERVFDEVEIGRLVEELDKATKALEHKKAAMFFDILAKRYEEMGNLEMKEHYGKLKGKYQQDGHLSLDDMNYSRHQSTQKISSGLKLVDAAELI